MKAQTDGSFLQGKQARWLVHSRAIKNVLQNNYQAYKSNLIVEIFKMFLINLIFKKLY